MFLFIILTGYAALGEKYRTDTVSDTCASYAQAPTARVKPHGDCGLFNVALADTHAWRMHNSSEQP